MSKPNSITSQSGQYGLTFYPEDNELTAFIDNKNDTEYVIDKNSIGKIAKFLDKDADEDINLLEILNFIQENNIPGFDEAADEFANRYKDEPSAHDSINEFVQKHNQKKKESLRNNVLSDRRMKIIRGFMDLHRR